MTSRDLFALANAAAMTASTIPGGTGVPALEVCCMLVVKVELWPDGVETRAREIRRAQCANVSGLTPTSDHVAIIVDEHGRRERPSSRPRERVAPLLGRVLPVVAGRPRVSLGRGLICAVRRVSVRRALPNCGSLPAGDPRLLSHPRAMVHA